MEAELLDSTEQLLEVEAQLNKLQKNLDSVLKEKVLDTTLTLGFSCVLTDHLGIFLSSAVFGNGWVLLMLFI